MEAMRQSWTDDRLDDFRAEVNRRFDQVDRRLDQMDQGFKEVDQHFKEVDHAFKEASAEVNRRFDQLYGQLLALHRAINRAAAGVIATLIGGILTLIGIAIF